MNGLLSRWKNVQNVLIKVKCFYKQDCFKVGEYEVCREAVGNSFLCTAPCQRICGNEICANIKGGKVSIEFKKIKISILVSILFEKFKDR